MEDGCKSHHCHYMSEHKLEPATERVPVGRPYPVGTKSLTNHLWQTGSSNGDKNSGKVTDARPFPARSTAPQARTSTRTKARNEANATEKAPTTADRRPILVPAAAGGTATLPRLANSDDTAVDDVLISVATSAQFHRSRLDALFATWIPLAAARTVVVTDRYDARVAARHPRTVVADCGNDDDDDVDTCKLQAAYEAYMSARARWWCGVRDETYLNVERLLRLLRALDWRGAVYVGRAESSAMTGADDDATFDYAPGASGFCVSDALAAKMASLLLRGGKLPGVARAFGAEMAGGGRALGFVVNRVLAVPIVTSELFHSHRAERVRRVTGRDVAKFVTLGYRDERADEFAVGDGARVVVDVAAPFPCFDVERDPTRFLSVHCACYPATPYCAELTRGKVDRVKMWLARGQRRKSEIRRDGGGR